MSLKRFSEGNKEILFGRPENVDLNYWQAHHLPKGIGGNAAMGVTQELVDAFYMKNGEMPILGYNEDGSPLSTRNRGMWKTDSLPIQSIEPRSGRAVDLRTLPIKKPV